MERMTMKTALDNLCFNYGKYGYTRSQFKDMLCTGLEHGLTVYGAYIGVKMIAAEYTGEQELFTSQDIAELTGETVQEVNERIEEYGEELKAVGLNPDDYFGKHDPIRIITRL